MRRSKAAGFIVGAVAVASGLAALGAVAGTPQASAPSDGNAQTLIAQWNGGALRRVASPNPSAPPGVNLLSGVSAAGPDDAWAAGLYSVYDTVSHTSQSYPLAEHWNGRAWTRIAAAQPG